MEETNYRQAFSLLRRYIGGEWQRALLLLFLLLSGIALQLLQPQILRDFLDLATGEIARARVGGLTALPAVAALFIGVALVNQLLVGGAAYVTQDLRWRTTNALRADLARHALRLEMGLHNDHTAGELVSRIDGDVDALSNFFSQFTLQVLGNGLLIVGVIAVLMAEDWRIGVGFLGFVVVAAAVLRVVVRLAVPWFRRFWELFGVYFGFFEERLASIEDIRANGAVAYTMRRYHELMRDVFIVDRNAFVLSLLPAATTLAFFNVGSALGLGLGGVLYWNGVITIGTVYVILNYAQLLQEPLARVTQQMEDFQRAVAAAGRIQWLYAVQPALATNAGAPFPLEPGPPRITFAGVDFHYSEEAPVLRNVSFEIAPGETLGLLGRTGSGKTTITRLLFRLYDVAGGCVELDGVDVRTLPLKELRRQIGLVTQDVQLFNASVRDNLTFFDETLPDEAIVAAFAELELMDWFEGLPEGLDTQLESGGRGLSAGEAQLVAFTRVFLQDPRIVILDEASSRLDPTTERLIDKAVHRLLHNRTAIIVAHRLATVQRVDEILILENGRVKEYGRREALAADPASQFSHLLRTAQEELLA
ncbi:MAG: ABC transporter ATP-binding protein [Candidatus Promineifilaceae bacterium]|nr:ABC transporter ATP-binding protein [Candidatus Promineifilaceae bacterium]